MQVGVEELLYLSGQQLTVDYVLSQVRSPAPFRALLSPSARLFLTSLSDDVSSR